jgi:hypothetical protein
MNDRRAHKIVKVTLSFSPFATSLGHAIFRGYLVAVSGALFADQRLLHPVSCVSSGDHRIVVAAHQLDRNPKGLHSAALLTYLRTRGRRRLRVQNQGPIPWQVRPITSGQHRPRSRSRLRASPAEPFQINSIPRLLDRFVKGIKSVMNIQPSDPDPRLFVHLPIAWSTDRLVIQFPPSRRDRTFISYGTVGRKRV